MSKPEFRYLKTHEWIRIKDGVATVGISEHAQGEVTDVVFVEPPKIGRSVKQSEACCVLESVKAAFDIYAPMSGEVVAVNDAAVKDPALVNRSAQDEGWLFRLKPSKLEEFDGLMDQKAYDEFLKSPAAHAGH